MLHSSLEAWTTYDVAQFTKEPGLPAALQQFTVGLGLPAMLHSSPEA
ncbi:hypothetical protein [Paenibacillus sp. GM2]|nr:hypothetical protein [Paenibacillus sp. GM2]